MGGHRHAGSSGNRRGPHPACHATDAHEIGHDIVARPALNCSLKVTGAIKIFADLDRRLQLPGKLCVTVEVIVNDRLFDPIQAEIVEHMTSLQGLGEVQSLIEIDHQVHVVANCIPDSLYRSEIIADAVASEAQFEAAESSFVTQLDRLFRRREAARRAPAVDEASLPAGPVPETAVPPAEPAAAVSGLQTPVATEDGRPKTEDASITP